MLWCGNCVSRISHRTSFFLTIALTDGQLLSFIQRMFFATLPREIKITPTWKGTLYILKSCYLEVWTAETILIAVVRDIWRLAIWFISLKKDHLQSWSRLFDQVAQEDNQSSSKCWKGQHTPPKKKKKRLLNIQSALAILHFSSVPPTLSLCISDKSLSFL